MVKVALIVVDPQKDFMPGGSLAVPRGDEIVPTVLGLLQHPVFSVVFTRDYHPQGHVSFASAHLGKSPFEKIEYVFQGNEVVQTLWPDHCVQGTDGSRFHPELEAQVVEQDFRVFFKGVDPMIDSYSGFYDNRRLQSTGLHEYLQKKDISRLFICGLAIDYCVSATAKDALDLGYEVYIVEDACRGIDKKTSRQALDDIVALGGHIVNSGEIM